MNLGHLAVGLHCSLYDCGTQLQVSARFGRTLPLTTGRPLADTADAGPQHVLPRIHTLATQPAGQTDFCLVPAKPAMRPEPWRPSDQCTAKFYQ